MRQCPLPLFLRLLSLCLFVSAASLAPASPLPPGIIASLSNNGKILVLTHQELGPSANGGRRILATTFQVMSPELMGNAKDHLQANATFWSEPSWQVTISRGERWALVSDDGQSLLLLSLAPSSANAIVLTLYRKNGQVGRLVRDFTFADLWTPALIRQHLSGIRGFTDATPQWFSGASFRLSADSRFMFYKSQWKTKTKVDLATGHTTPEPSHRLPSR